MLLWLRALCFLFYGSFRFTTPRNRGRRREEEVEETKQNKYRGNATPARTLLRQTGGGGRDGARKGHRGREK